MSFQDINYLRHIITYTILLLQEARDNLFRPAAALVNKVLLEERIDENPCPSLPKPENMARAANRLRQLLRPEDPTDLAFETSEENIPADFRKADVCIRNKRHLVFAAALGVRNQPATSTASQGQKLVRRRDIQTLSPAL